ncbi:hypothetical protein, partial [Pseudoalteromonas sp. SYSU M81241]
GTIYPELISVKATSGGVVRPRPQDSTSHSLNNDQSVLNPVGYDKVGAAGAGESKVFYLQLFTPLKDADPDVEYVLTFEPRAIVSKDGS